jgi:hypothetical protein
MAYNGQPSDSQFNALVYGNGPLYDSVFRVASLNRAQQANFVSITSTQLTSNVLTVTGSNTLTVGQAIEFFDMTGATFLNGVFLVVATLIGAGPTYTGFTANFTHANYGATAETGFGISATYTTALTILSQEDPAVSGAFNITAVSGAMAIPTATDVYAPIGNAGVVWPTNGIVGANFAGNHEGNGNIYGTTPVQTVSVTTNVLTVTPQSGYRYSPWIIGTTVTFEGFTTATFLNRATITATSVTSNVLTVTCANHFQAGQLVRLLGTAESALNNQIVTVSATGLSTSSFQAALTTGNYTNAADTGFASPVATVTASSYSGGGSSAFTATLGTVSNLSSTTDTTGVIIGGTFLTSAGIISTTSVNQTTGGIDMLCGQVIDTGLQGRANQVCGTFYTQQSDQAGYADSTYVIYMQDQLQTARSRVGNTWCIYEAGGFNNRNNLGTVYVNGHLGANAANADISGTVTVTNPATSQTVNFTNAFASAPIVTLTPTSDPSVAGIVSYWVTTATGSFTVHVNTTPGTSITFNYHVIGNPN